MKTNVKLPDKLSELLRLALADLEKCERSKKYIVSMMHWHTPEDDGKCAVCLAGAVLAKTLKADIRESFCGIEFGPEVAAKTWALENVREGFVNRALGEMGVSATVDLDRKISPYEDAPDQFKADMRKLADDLEAAGL